MSSLCLKSKLWQVSSNSSTLVNFQRALQIDRCLENLGRPVLLAFVLTSSMHIHATGMMP